MVIEGRVREIDLRMTLGTELAGKDSLAILLGLLKSCPFAFIVLADGFSLAETGLVLRVAHLLLEDR